MDAEGILGGIAAVITATSVLVGAIFGIRDVKDRREGKKKMEKIPEQIKDISDGDHDIAVKLNELYEYMTQDLKVRVEKLTTRVTSLEKSVNEKDQVIDLLVEYIYELAKIVVVSKKKIPKVPDELKNHLKDIES